MDELIEAFEADPHILRVEPNLEGSLSHVPASPLYAQVKPDLDLIGMEAAWDIQ
jgi:hypothetical protein